MAWALKNDTEETAEYNSHDGRRRPGEVPRKKLKALGLTKNAPREREWGLLYTQCGHRKNISSNNNMPTKLSPSIPLQTTEVVKRPKISDSLAFTRLCCACAAMLNSRYQWAYCPYQHRIPPPSFNVRKGLKGEKKSGGGGGLRGEIKTLFTNNLNISFASYHPPT